MCDAVHPAMHACRHVHRCAIRNVHRHEPCESPVAIAAVLNSMIAPLLCSMAIAAVLCSMAIAAVLHSMQGDGQVPQAKL